MSLLDAAHYHIEAVKRMDALLNARPHLAERLEIHDVLTTKAERAVFDATFDGRHAVAKLMWQSGAPEALGRQINALRRRLPQMADGPVRVPEILHVAPGAGLMVLGFVEGKTGHTLETDAGFPQLLAAARLWIETAAQGNTHESPAPRKGLRRQLDALRPASDEPALADLLAKVTAATRAHIDATDAPLTRTLGHGDFKPRNLIIGPDHVTAIDLSGHDTLPLVADIARFVTAASVGENGGPDTWGVAPHILAAMTTCLTDDDAKWLPAYIGLNYAQRLAKVPRLIAADHRRPAFDAFLSAPIGTH